VLRFFTDAVGACNLRAAQPFEVGFDRLAEKCGPKARAFALRRRAAVAFRFSVDGSFGYREAIPMDIEAFHCG